MEKVDEVERESKYSAGALPCSSSVLFLQEICRQLQNKEQKIEEKIKETETKYVWNYWIYRTAGSKKAAS